MDVLKNILISCLTKLMTSYNEITPLIEEGKAKDIIFLAFSKVSNTVFYKILIKKLMKYRLEAQPVRWTEPWLDDHIKGVVMNHIKSS